MSRCAALTIAVAGVLTLGGCTSNEPSGAETSTEAADDTTPISVTIPPERTTPFCTAVNDLNDQIVTGDVTDVEALIIETYRSILPDVPIEIADDFRAVLTELETGVPAPTAPPVTQPVLTPSTDPETGDTIAEGPNATTEFFFPATTPAQRVNEYVSFACQGAENNPGPQATAPLDEATSDDS